MSTGRFVINFTDKFGGEGSYLVMPTEKKVNQDSAFWEQACVKFNQHLFSRAYRLANGNIYDAEDLMQETVCRVLMYTRNSEEIRNPLGYLLRMMRNVWMDKWKHENQANIESLDNLLSNNGQQKHHRVTEPAVESDVLRILENEELLAQMRVKQGPLTNREELLLKLHLEGLTCKEIATKLNEDARLTRSDLNAVRTKIRYRLKNA